MLGARREVLADLHLLPPDGRACEVQRAVRATVLVRASGAAPTAAAGLLFGGLYSPAAPTPHRAQACPRPSSADPPG